MADNGFTSVTISFGSFFNISTRQSDVTKRGHVVLILMFTRQSDVRKRGHVVPMFTRQSDVRKRGHVVPRFTRQSDFKNCAQVFKLSNLKLKNFSLPVCQNNCSNHGQCDLATKRCMCDPYWMENFFKANLWYKEKNCGKICGVP